MKIAWFCIPAYGHTNPTLGLVKAMVERGHEIYYFSFEMFREKIERAGAHFIGCDSYDFALEGNGKASAIGNNLAFSMELLVSSTLALDEMAARTIHAIQPDVIVSDSMAFWGKLAAMKHRIPYVSSTTTFAFNRYSSRYLKTGFKDMLNTLASMPKVHKQLQRLRDKGYPVKSVLDIIQNDNDTRTIVYTSKYYQPCSETFSDKYCFIGPSIRPVETPMAKTADRTIYISMGTVLANHNLYKTCVDALKDTDYQVIVSLGTSDIHFNNLPKNIQVYPSVDQMAALSISDAFITHCGMNSASEGLYFKVPLILCPQTSEEGAVAKRTEELGAGITLKTVEKSAVLNAVDQVLHQPKYRQSAGEISASFQQSGGADKAVDFLEHL